MTALQKRGRGGPKEPFVPDEAWIEAFDTQFRAPTFYERMKLFARSKARALGFYGGVVDEYYIEEIVADVVGDTLDGVIRWDPKRVDLKKHMLDAIGYRIRDDIKHAHDFKHLDVDDELVQDQASHALADAHAADDERARFGAAATASLDALRELAGDDIELVMLIDGYRTGASEKAELLVVTGLTSAQYKAARQRLPRLVERLPDHLRLAAMRIR